MITLRRGPLHDNLRRQPKLQARKASGHIPAGSTEKRWDTLFLAVLRTAAWTALFSSRPQTVTVLPCCKFNRDCQGLYTMHYLIWTNIFVMGILWEQPKENMAMVNLRQSNGEMNGTRYFQKYPCRTISEQRRNPGCRIARGREQ